MELIAAVLLATPLGYLVRPRARSLGLYLVAWAAILPVQTVSVHDANPDDINAQYAVAQAVILALGVGFNALGARLRAAR